MSTSRLSSRTWLIRWASVWFAVAAAMILAGPAVADPATEGDAAGAVFGNGGHIYVSGEAGQQVDQAAVTSAIGDDEIYVAVVPPNMPPGDVLTQIQNGLQLPATYLVISGTEHTAVSSLVCAAQVQPLLDQAAATHADALATGDLTAFITGYVQSLQNAPASGTAACGDGTGDDGLGAILPWALGVVVVVAIGGYLWLRRNQKHKAVEHEGRRAEVTTLLDTLAHEIDEVGQQGGPVVQHALDDARERHIAAADILAVADDDVDFDAAERAGREGRCAAFYARRDVGLATEPPPAVEPAVGASITVEELVAIDGEQVVAHPAYRPGVPFYFAGTEDLPAGWYPLPLADAQLLGSIASDE